MAKAALKFKLQTGSDTEGGSGEVLAMFNPFPGLRPFSIGESHLFFGREGQVDQILDRLSKHHSVAILGSSGSGKSSLIYSGVVPVLYGGFMTEIGPNWIVIQARPGISPIDNLATAIAAHLLTNDLLSRRDFPAQKTVIASILRGNPNGLIVVSDFLKRKSGENICFLLDQFEELFRFRNLHGDESLNEALQYVTLVQKALEQKDSPVYVAISMRSDFINDCNDFAGLPEIINKSNYVVPKMTRNQKQSVIEGPVSVGGGRISNRLTKRLLSDLENVEDALPILQHALMRTWDYWMDNHEEGEPMDIRHYNAVGKIEQALSQHADEAYDELSTRDKEIAEIVFKNITEKNQDNQGMRRPGRIREIAELAGASEEEIVTVVDQFRKPGRSFLMPGIHVPLQSDSIVEISHESIMRIWTRLTGWVDDEYESSQMYKRLSEASAMYQIGRTGLWRPPDLQLALNWQKKQNPTRTWAQRYDVAFERAIVFLDTSRITYEAELKNQEMLQRRMLRRARVTNIVLSLAFIVAMIFFIFGLTQRIEADKRADEALSQQQRAELARKDAEKQKDLATEALKRVEEQEQLLSKNNKNLQVAISDALSAKQQAEINLNRSRESEKQANLARALEEEQKLRAEAASKEARESYERANGLLMLTIAQSMEAKVENLEDPQLAGLLAMQGYQFHMRYQGNQYDPYVFNGLYYANAKLKGLNYNATVVPGNLRNRMSALAVSAISNTFYVSGSDGRIFNGNVATTSVGNQVASNNFPNRVLALSPDEKYLVVGSDSSDIQVFSLPILGNGKIIKGHRGSVNDIKFLPDNSGFISVGADNTIRFNNHITGQSNLILALQFSLKTIALNGKGTIMVGAASNGQVIAVNLSAKTFSVIRDEAPNRILSVAFHPTQNRIAYGMEIIENNKVQRGLVKVIDGNNRIKELSGNTAGVSDVEFSPDGFLLAAAGLDRKLQMWVVDHVDDLPIVMDNNNGNIWNIAFSKGSDYLVATCVNGEVRIWPTNPKLLADQVCPNLTRIMSQEEWDIYVGNEIPFEKTCKN